MTLNTLNIRRALAAVALVASIGPVFAWGPFSIAMLDTSWGKVAAAVSLAVLGSTWLPRPRAALAVAVLAGAAGAGCDVYLWYRISTVDTGGWGTVSPGWGLMLQTVAAIAVVTQPVVELVLQRRAVTA